MAYVFLERVVHGLALGAMPAEPYGLSDQCII